MCKWWVAAAGKWDKRKTADWIVSSNIVMHCEKQACSYWLLLTRYSAAARPHTDHLIWFIGDLWNNWLKGAYCRREQWSSNRCFQHVIIILIWNKSSVHERLRSKNVQRISNMSINAREKSLKYLKTMFLKEREGICIFVLLECRSSDHILKAAALLFTQVSIHLS